MTSAARLMTAVSVTNTFKRNIYTAQFYQDFKVKLQLLLKNVVRLLHERRKCSRANKFSDHNSLISSFYCDVELKVSHMSMIPLNDLLIKNLREEPSGPEALFSTHLDLLESNTDQKTQAEFRRTTMEPYLNKCYETVDQQMCPADIYTSNDDAAQQRSSPLIPENPHLYSNLPNKSKFEKAIRRGKDNYTAMRAWKKVRREQEIDPKESCLIRLFSYNILAQYLLATHSYLYKYHDKRTLNWILRRELLIQEILEAQANVICLQEMQEDHLDDFLKPFHENGYNHLYKKRTNDKEDGLLLLYRSDTFNLIESTSVEFYQSGVDILSRDNVAIIVKLSLKDSPETNIVIATTHLLFNPKRNDIRLGQTQILMAEIERIAFVKYAPKGPMYHPIIISGDFNLPPHSGVYQFITKGSFQYVGKSRTLGPPDHHCLANSLIPPHLYITDSCQHYHLLLKRLCNQGEGQIMLANSEMISPNTVHKKSDSNQFKENNVDVQTTQFQKLQICHNSYVSFGSGHLTHPFHLRSVYSHKDNNGQDEVTTYQDEWLTVDYIFYGGVDLFEKYTLPTQRQCRVLSTIPNLGIGSDHLSLGATFVIRKKKK